MQKIDAIGLLCPLPVLKLRKALAGIPEGGQVCLIATDPAAAIDVPHFCAENGHSLLSQERSGEVTRFTVQRG